MQVSLDMLDRATSDPTFMGCNIIGDEAWVYEYLHLHKPTITGMAGERPILDLNPCDFFCFQISSYPSVEPVSARLRPQKKIRQREL